jgi:hypothetical protein
VIIAVVNHARRTIHDDELQNVLRAINRQIEGDFAAHWDVTATLRLEGRTRVRPSIPGATEIDGDAVLYLWDGGESDDALGYHDLCNRGTPYGFVFPLLSKEMGEHWSVTLSHEALELIGDPEANLVTMGPHPKQRGRDVFHWREMCDAVQAERYVIDGVAVSNFVLPLYFTRREEIGSRNDFLGGLHAGRSLRSFGVNPGGYVGFYDPVLRDSTTFEADELAARRQRIKDRMGGARRGIRYRHFQMGAVTPAARRASRA